MNAATEADVQRYLGADPWELDGRLTTTAVESWNLVVGRTVSAPTSPP